MKNFKYLHPKYLIVKFDMQEAITPGGIHRPEDQIKKTAYATVIQSPVGHFAQPGDVVLCEDGTGVEIDVAGETVSLLLEDHVLTVV